MAESLTAARPYAKALYEVATSNDLNAWMPVMQICQALGDNDDTRRFLNAHDLTVDKFNSTLQSVFAAASITTLPAHFADFIKVLGQNKRFALLPDIATLFVEEVNKSNDTLVAEIISAKPLDAASEKTLVNKLVEKYGKKVEASIEIDESLIGGAVIKVGDTVIDGSIKGRLEQLTKALN